jgi:hypothetical protein
MSYKVISIPADLKEHTKPPFFGWIHKHDFAFRLVPGYGFVADSPFFANPCWCCVRPITQYGKRMHVARGFCKIRPAK